MATEKQKQIIATGENDDTIHSPILHPEENENGGSGSGFYRAKDDFVWNEHKKGPQHRKAEPVSVYRDEPVTETREEKVDKVAKGVFIGVAILCIAVISVFFIMIYTLLK